MMQVGGSYLLPVMLFFLLRMTVVMLDTHTLCGTVIYEVIDFQFQCFIMLRMMYGVQ